MEQFLIERLQNFTLDRKILSIDSDDRDKSKWPNANEFEISTPQVYNKVESLRLTNVRIPNNLYNISEHLQNNKMIIEDISNNDDIEITLNNGYYTNDNICDEIKKQAVNKLLSFSVDYDNITLKPTFTCDTSFSLKFFDNNITYNSISNCINKVYQQHSNWGLGAILGFDNKNFVTSRQNSSNNSSFSIIPSNKLNLNFNQYIYLEIDKYNTCDEIKPFINDRFSNSNIGLVNSYFCKIPIKFKSDDILYCYENLIDSLSYYQPPIEKISKLKFKFRYHNGILIDLGNYNISCTLEINQIRNEMKNYNVRTPFKF